MRRNKKRITIGIILLVFYFLPSFLPFLNISKAQSKNEDQPTVLFCSKPIEHGRKSRKEVIKEYIQLVFVRNPTAKEVKIEVSPNDRNTKINYYESLEGDFDFKQFSKDRCDYEFCADICVPTCYKVDALEFTLKSKDGILLLSSNSNKGLSIFPLSREINVINVESCEELAKVTYYSAISAYSLEIENALMDIEKTNLELLKEYEKFYEEIAETSAAGGALIVEELELLNRKFVEKTASVLRTDRVNIETIKSFTSGGNKELHFPSSDAPIPLYFSSDSFPYEYQKKIINDVINQYKKTGRVYERVYALATLLYMEGDKIVTKVVDVMDITLESKQYSAKKDDELFMEFRNKHNSNVNEYKSKTGRDIYIPEFMRSGTCQAVRKGEIIEALKQGKAILLTFDIHIHPRWDVFLITEFPSGNDLFVKFENCKNIIEKDIEGRYGIKKENLDEFKRKLREYYLVEGHFSVVGFGERDKPHVGGLRLTAEQANIYLFSECFVRDCSSILKETDSLMEFFKGISKDSLECYKKGECMYKSIFISDYDSKFLKDITISDYVSLLDSKFGFQLSSWLEANLDDINYFLDRLFRIDNIEELLNDERIKNLINIIKKEKTIFYVGLDGGVHKDSALPPLKFFANTNDRIKDLFYDTLIKKEFLVPQDMNDRYRIAEMMCSHLRLISSLSYNGCMENLKSFIESGRVDNIHIDDVNLIKKAGIETNDITERKRMKIFLTLHALEALATAQKEELKKIPIIKPLSKDEIREFRKEMANNIVHYLSKLGINLNSFDGFINLRYLIDRIEEQVNLRKYLEDETKKLLDEYEKTLDGILKRFGSQIKINREKLDNFKKYLKEYSTLVEIKEEYLKISQLSPKIEGTEDIARIKSAGLQYLNEVKSGLENLKTKVEKLSIDEGTKSKLIHSISSLQGFVEEKINYIKSAEKISEDELLKIEWEIKKRLEFAIRIEIEECGKKVIKELLSTEKGIIIGVESDWEKSEKMETIKGRFENIMRKIESHFERLQSLLESLRNNKILNRLKSMVPVEAKNLLSYSGRAIFAVILGDPSFLDKTQVTPNQATENASPSRKALALKVTRASAIFVMVIVLNALIGELALGHPISSYAYTTLMSITQLYSLSYLAFHAITGSLKEVLKVSTLARFGVIITVAIIVGFSIYCGLTEKSFEGFVACMSASIIVQPMCRYDKGKYAVTEKSRIPKDEEYKDPGENTIFLLKSFSDKIAFWAKDIPLVNTKTCPPSWLWYFGEGVYILLKYRESGNEKVISEKIKIHEDGSGSVEFKIEKPLTYFITLQERGTIFGKWDWIQDQKIGYLSFEECKGKIVEANKVYTKDQIINVIDENRVCINPCPNFNCPKEYECSDGICIPKVINEKEKCKNERKYYDAKSGKCCDRGICVIDRGISIDGCIYPEDESIAIEAIMMCNNNPRSNECIEKAEELKKRGYGSSITKMIPSIIQHTACCSKNQCVFEGKCYNTNSRIDVGNNKLICDSGIWKVSGCEIGEAKWDGYNLVIPFSNCKLSELKGYAYVDVEKIVESS